MFMLALLATVVTILAHASTFGLVRFWCLMAAWALIGAIGILLMFWGRVPRKWKTFHRQNPQSAETISNTNILLQGTWRKAYTWQGKPGAETADIKEDSYYLEGETQPRFWLRDVTYNPTTREVRLKLVSVGDGIVWDTETLTLSPDERHMVGRSERFGHEVRYERQFDDDEHSGQGQ